MVLSKHPLTELKPKRKSMKALLDYLPAVVFFIVYFLFGRDIYLATWAILAASALQISINWLVWRRSEALHWAVFVITLLFGGLTLFLRDPLFIMWRPTIIYAVLAAVLLVGTLLKRSFLQRMVEALAQKSLNYVPPFTRKNWIALNLLCSAYFIFLATLNIVVAYQFSETTWVNVKMFGFTILNLVFYPVLLLFAYRMLAPEARQELLERLNGPTSPDK